MVCSPLMMRYGTIVKKMTVIIIIIYKNKTVVTKIKDFFSWWTFQWFALRFPSAAIYLDTLRECYEAYVIYNFMRYLVNFLHQEHPQLDLMLENKPRVKHFIPFCCLPPWPPGKYGFIYYV